jgi:hypothetical protein
LAARSHAVNPVISVAIPAMMASVEEVEVVVVSLVTTGLRIILPAGFFVLFRQEARVR